MDKISSDSDTLFLVDAIQSKCNFFALVDSQSDKGDIVSGSKFS
jgi:hypothetical protein